MTVPALDRPLTASERSVWRMDAGAPMNYVVLARVAGGLDEAALRAALDAVQRRHPALRARVVVRDGEHRFASDDVGPLPLRVVHAEAVGATDDTAAAHACAEDDLVERYPEAGPLARATLVPATTGDAATLVLGVHHVVGDGRSVPVLLRDVLRAAGAALDGDEPALPPVTDVLPLDARLPRVARGPRAALRAALFLLRSAWTDARRGPPVRPRTDEPLPPHARRPRLLPVTLDEGVVSRLVARARAEGATLHGALSAATLLGIVDDSGHGLPAVVDFGHPYDLRPHLDPPVTGDVHGLFVSIVPFSTRLGEDAALWPLAREVTTGLARAVSRHAPWTVLSLSVRLGRALGADRLPPREYAENWERRMQGTGGLTNLGRLDLPERAGPLRLEDVRVAFHPSAMAIFSSVASGWDCRLQWSFMWPDPGMTRAHAEALVDAITGRLLEGLAG